MEKPFHKPCLNSGLSPSFHAYTAEYVLALPPKVQAELAWQFAAEREIAAYRQPGGEAWAPLG